MIQNSFIQYSVECLGSHRLFLTQNTVSLQKTHSLVIFPMDKNTTSTKKLMKLMEGKKENNLPGKNDSHECLESERVQPETFNFYQLGPSGEITDAEDSNKIRQILIQIQTQANRFFTEHKRGRIKCKSKDYNILISKSKGSLIIKVKGRESGKVILSQRIKVGGYIVT